MINRALNDVLEKQFYEISGEELLDIDLDEFFLEYEYFRLPKDMVVSILDTELSDRIREYAIDSSKLGFEAGVDLVLTLQGRDPAFGILKDYFDEK